MSEAARSEVEDALQALRDKNTPPKIRRLRLAIEAFILKAPGFAGDSDLCIEIAIALADVEAETDAH